MAKIVVLLNQAVETEASSSGNYGEGYYDEYPQGATGTVLQESRFSEKSLIKFDNKELGCTWLLNSVLTEVK